ncbi:MAG: serine hydrolase domain-containing protein [Ruminococcus sp.]|nr:serine hydrolase domain-containing protein [Ruminococcus sp.]
MKTFLKQLLCVILAGNTALSLCACGCDDKPKTEPSDTTAVQTTNSTNNTTQVNTTIPDNATTDQIPSMPTLNHNKIKQDAESIEARFNTILKSHNFMGTIYYKIGNDFEYIGNNGFSNEDTHTYNSINTDYYIGSLTKQFTAVAIMLLQEEGKLSTSDTLDKYFPEYEYGSEITIRHLLTMTDGIPDYLNKENELTKNNTRVCDVDSDNSYDQNHDIIINWILSQDLVGEYEEYNYSNSGYYLLGDIIEKVSSEKYDDYIKNHILDPIGMCNTGFEKTDMLAIPYRNVHDNYWTTYNGVGYSSVGMISNIGDMLKWTDALCGEEFLSIKSKEELFTPYKSDFACGFFVNDMGIYNNDTSFYSFNSTQYFSYEKSLIFFAFSNYSQNDLAIVKAEFDKVIEEYII